MKDMHRSDQENLRKNLENKIEIYKNKYNKDVVSQRKFNGHEEYKNSLNSKDLIFKLEIEKLKEKISNLEKEKVKLNEILDSKNEKIKEMTNVVKDYDIITKRLHNECVYQKRSFDFKHIENRLLKNKLGKNEGNNKQNPENVNSIDNSTYTFDKNNKSNLASRKNINQNENNVNSRSLIFDNEFKTNKESYKNNRNNSNNNNSNINNNQEDKNNDINEKIQQFNNFLNNVKVNNNIEENNLKQGNYNINNLPGIKQNSSVNYNVNNFNHLQKSDNIENSSGNDRILNMMKNLQKNKDNKPYFVTEDMKKS